MRIEGPRPNEGIRKTDKARKSGAASSSFGAMLEPETEEASEARASVPPSSLGMLFAVQGYEDPVQEKTRKRMRDRAAKVLDVLGDVHKGLVTGTLNTGQLEDMSRAIAEKREAITDPRLSGILDEIDLRAQVEIAKLEMAAEKHKKS